MINLKILSHPMNWLTLAIWLFALAYIAACAKIIPVPSNKPAQASLN